MAKIKKKMHSTSRDSTETHPEETEVIFPAEKYELIGNSIWNAKSFAFIYLIFSPINPPPTPIRSYAETRENAIVYTHHMTILRTLYTEQ